MVTSRTISLGSSVCSRSAGPAGALKSLPMSVARRPLGPRMLTVAPRARSAGASVDAGLLVVDLNGGERTDARDADDAGGLGDVFLLHVVQVGAAGEQLGVAPAVLQESNRLLRRGGAKIGEVFHMSLSSRGKIL